MAGLKGLLVNLLRTKVMRELLGRSARIAMQGLFPWYMRRFGTRQDATWFSYRAWLAVTEERWPTAIYLANLAIAADPTLGDGHRALGLAHKGTGEPDRARQAYEQGLLAAPDSYRLAMALGDLELEQRRYDEAETAFRRALAVRPDDPDVLWQLARSVGLQG